MFLSIITPTYNRAYVLNRCYESLTCQSDKDFEWIVVDDGSTDNTRELVELFIAEKKIAIKYFKQENGGKQRAHNRGVSEATGELCICVDSDDALSPNAVEVAKRIWSNTDTLKHIGILAKRGDFKEHNPICDDWPEYLADCTMLELQEKYGFTGDTALFFKTSLMKENYFAEFANEKFVPEDSLYVELDESGTMILEKSVLYYCEYLSDGLTANYRKLLISNPMGTSYCYYRRMLHSKKFKHRVRNAIISKAFLLQAGRKCEYEHNNHRIIQAIARVCAPIYCLLKNK